MRPIVIAAGGTGGHMAPAQALAEALAARGERVVLLTDKRAAARGLSGFGEHHIIAGGGIAGHGRSRVLRSALALSRGIAQSRRILSRLEPSVVVGFGGYPSAAPVLAARSVRPRPRVILHEQNAVLGRANRFLTRYAATLALSLPDTTLIPAGTHTALVGNPVRAAFVASPYAPPTDCFRLLVLGGSLGARVFADLLPEALAALPSALRDWLTVVQQCRVEDLTRVRAAYVAAGITAELSPHFDDVPARMAGAHLVIARAGASTVAELAVAGRPSLLIPLPGAIDDHQTGNALSLAAIGAATVLPQPGLTSAALSRQIARMMDDAPALIATAAAAGRAARPHAAEALADLVLAEALAVQERRP